MRFENRVALITGAGRGIGQATAVKLASEGAAVVAADMDVGPAQETVDLIKAKDGRAVAVACDVTDRAAVEAAVQKAVSEYGKLEILVACAGIIRDNMLFKMSDEDWDSVIDTHLKGTFNAARAAQAPMVQGRWGKMVFISSTSALGNRGQANYSTAKAGLQGMAKTIAIELGQFNVNVNAVAPGFIETRMTRMVAERTGADFEQMKKDAAARIPLRRVGEPEDVANVIAFLCSDDASYVSGQIIYVAVDQGPSARMKVDTNLPAERPSEAAEAARAAEAIGFDGMWTAETSHDPFLSLAFAAAATERIELGTAVAIAFARSPTVLAHTAWDLANLSAGRFILGLGTQVKAHVERRFAMPWSAPVPRLREYVGLVRAIWASWQEGKPFAFRGEHYSADLMTPFFSPPRLEWPRPPIYVAGVAPPLLRLAGEVADGLSVHPFHTRAYLAEVIHPAVETGARRSGRSARDCAISVPAFVVTGRDPEERGRVREQVRAQIAFYASTRSYEPVLAHHGWAGIRRDLSSLAARGRWADMPDLISSEMLAAFAIDVEPADVGPALREKYQGLADRITFARRFAAGEDDSFWCETLKTLRS